MMTYPYFPIIHQMPKNSLFLLHHCDRMHRFLWNVYNVSISKLCFFISYLDSCSSFYYSILLHRLDVHWMSRTEKNFYKYFFPSNQPRDGKMGSNEESLFYGVARIICIIAVVLEFNYTFFVYFYDSSSFIDSYSALVVVCE